MRSPQGFTPLLIAAQEGHSKICSILLAHGSDVNEEYLKSKLTALQLAASQGHVAVVEALLSWGAIVDPQDHFGHTPLHVACTAGHVACVLALLKAGASIYLPNLPGALPIHAAAKANRVDIVRILLDYDCSPNMVTVSCCDKTLTTIMKSFLLSGGESESQSRGNTAHFCSKWSSY